MSNADKQTVEIPLKDLIALRRDQENYYELLYHITNALSKVTDPSIFREVAKRYPISGTEKIQCQFTSNLC